MADDSLGATSTDVVLSNTSQRSPANGSPDASHTDSQLVDQQAPTKAPLLDAMDVTGTQVGKTSDPLPRSSDSYTFDNDTRVANDSLTGLYRTGESSTSNVPGSVNGALAAAGHCFERGSTDAIIADVGNAANEPNSTIQALNKAIEYVMPALENDCPPNSPNIRIPILGFAANLFLQRWVSCHHPDDLHKAIELHSEAAGLYHHDDIQGLLALTPLHRAYEAQFSTTGNREALDKMIETSAACLNLLIPGHEDHAVNLHTLAQERIHRHELYGPSLDDMDEAIVLYSYALTLPTSAFRDPKLVPRQLVETLGRRYVLTGKTEDLEWMEDLIREWIRPVLPTQMENQSVDRAEVTKAAAAQSGPFMRRVVAVEPLQPMGQVPILSTTTEVVRPARAEGSIPMPPEVLSAAGPVLIASDTPRERDDIVAGESQRENKISTSLARRKTTPKILAFPHSVARKIISRLNYSGEDVDILLNRAMSASSGSIGGMQASTVHRARALDELATGLKEQVLSAQELAEIICHHIDPDGRPPNIGEFDWTGEEFTRWFRELLMQVAGKALAAGADYHPHYAKFLKVIGDELQCAVTAEEIHTVVALLSTSIAQYDPGDRGSESDKGLAICTLAQTLFVKYKMLGTKEDLDRAVQSYKDALALPHFGQGPNHGDICLNLASMFYARHEDDGAEADLQEAITLYQKALSFHPRGHPARGFTLHHLSLALITRYHQTQSKADLDLAVVLGSEALDSEMRTRDGAERAFFLSSFASTLELKHRITEDQESYDRALQLREEALQLVPVDDSDHCLIVSSVAASLVDQFYATGLHEHLEASLKFHSEALKLAPRNHYRRGMLLQGLARALALRYQLKGAAEDLENTMQLLYEALKHHPVGHYARDTTLINIGTALIIRYRSMANEEDLEESKRLFTESLTRLRPGHVARVSVLQGLAQCSAHRFCKNPESSIDDLHKAMEYHGEAFNLSKDGHADRSRVLCDYAADMILMYNTSGVRAQLEHAIWLSEESLKLSKTEKAINIRALKVSTRALHLLCRTGNATGEAVLQVLRRCKELVEIAPPGSRGHASTWEQVANHLVLVLDWLGAPGDFADADIQIRNFLEEDWPWPIVMKRPRNSLSTSELLIDRIFQLLKAGAMDEKSPLHDSISCLGRWLQYGRDSHHPSIDDGYIQATVILRRFLNIGPTVRHQYKALESNLKALSIPMDAASYYVDQGKIDSAVEVLDETRSLLWGEMRRFRGDVDHRSRNMMGDDLANDFATVCTELRGVSVAESFGQDYLQTGTESTAGTLYTPRSQIFGSHARQALPYDFLLAHKRTLIERLDKLLDKIREIPGLEDFQRMLPFNKLQQAAKRGPIIIINCSKYRSHAIVVFHDRQPVPISLDEGDNPQYFHQNAIRLQEQFQEVREGIDSEDWANNPQAMGHKLYPILQDLWWLVVEKVVQVLEPILPKGSRIWWCPTSSTTVLPFHAAGSGTQDKKQHIIDHYVSSYTSTLRALLEARKPVSPFELSTQTDLLQPKILVVAQDNPPPEKFSPLSSLDLELDVIQDLNTFTHTLRGDDAEKSVVTEALRTHPWAHFICHGTVDASSPFESSLHLNRGQRGDDSELSLSDMIQAHLPNAQFAFLSACHTASQPSNLKDEVLHLAAAMQFIGFRSVVGTMWAMVDGNGPNVAKRFYKQMLADNKRARKSRVRSITGLDLSRLAKRALGQDQFGNNADDLDELQHERAARALWNVTQEMRKQKKGIEWINFIHIGA